VYGGLVYLVSVQCVFPSMEHGNVARWVWGEAMWALAMACSIARRMYSWSHSMFAMLLPCYVYGALLALEEKTKSSGYSDWRVCEVIC
jgi:hypothetical protein